ncbi:MAG: hypothetical protein WBE97_09105, partial [Candidatus Acidiferrales bacterium]
MTRFLYDAPGDLDRGDANQDAERLFAYHQATKHTFDSVRANAHFLDWRNQPNPFRLYEGAPLISLSPDPRFPEAGTFATMAALTENPSSLPTNASERGEEIRFDAKWLSQLLWYSMAVSA